MGVPSRFGAIQADAFLGSAHDNSAFGKIWYVDVNNGSDGNSGQAPDEAYATIGAAITASVATRGDSIVIAPGTYTITAALAPVAFTTFRAAVVVPHFPSVSIRGNIASLLTVNVSGCRFVGLEFRATGTTSAQLVNIANTAAVNGALFEDCVFHGADVARTGGVIGISAVNGTNATNGLVVRRCVFRDLGNTQLSVGVLGLPYGKIEDNLFAIDSNGGTGIQLADTTAVATGKGLVIRQNDFTGLDTTANEVGITMRAATEDQTAGIMIRNNFFALIGAGAAITANTQTRAIVNNYAGDTGTGGTLVDAGN